MTTLRQRFRKYWRADEFPQTPEWYSCPDWYAAGGAVLVMIIAFVATAPAAFVLLALTPQHISLPVSVVLGLVLIPLSAKMGRYVGAPVVDHLLGVPREGLDG